MAKCSSSMSAAPRHCRIVAAPPPRRMSRPPAASVACCSAAWMPPVTKVVTNPRIPAGSTVGVTGPASDRTLDPKENEKM